MSNIPTTQIDGDVVMRNLTAQGSANVQGNVRVGHDLKVEGWLEAKNIKSANKGLFQTRESLEAAYPTPQDGWFAGVYATEDDLASMGVVVKAGSVAFRMYIGNGGNWTATQGFYEITVDDNRVTEVEEALSAVDIATVEVARNWEGMSVKLTRNDGSWLTAPIQSVHIDDDPTGDSDLAGLITPSMARQIGINADRINTLDAKIDTAKGELAANIDYLMYEHDVQALAIDEANQAAGLALEGVQSAEDAAVDAKAAAKEAAESAKQHRADVGIYPIKGIAEWRYDGEAGTVEGETYLREEDTFLTVSVGDPAATEPECKSFSGYPQPAEGVDPSECGRNLLLDTNKQLGQWICRTGASDNSVDPIDHEQFYGDIAEKRYDADRWPELKPSQGDQVGFVRSSLAADPDLTWEILLYPLRNDVVRAGRRYTLRLTTYGTPELTFQAYLAKLTGADALCAPADDVVTVLANEARVHTFTLEATANGADDAAGVYYVYLNIEGTKGSWHSFEVWDIKLEEGDEATPWTKAPDDSTPWLKAEVKMRNEPYNYRYRPMADSIYRLGSSLYRYKEGEGLVEIGAETAGGGGGDIPADGDSITMEDIEKLLEA